MKKLSRLAAIFTAIALTLAFTACSHPNSGDDGGSTSNHLDGTYKYSWGSNGQNLTFLENGTIQVNNGPSGNNNGSGTYTISGDTLSGNASFGSNDSLTVTGTKTSDTVWTISITWVSGGTTYTEDNKQLIKQ